MLRFICEETFLHYYDHLFIYSFNCGVKFYFLQPSSQMLIDTFGFGEDTLVYIPVTVP
jgi:hypothetical protein